MAATRNIGRSWDTLDDAGKDLVVAEVHSFVVTTRIGRRRLIPKKP